MPQKSVAMTIKVNGMTCTNCENRIEQALQKTPGVIRVQVFFARAKADILYNPDRVSRDAIMRIIESQGYSVDRPVIDPEKTPVLRVIGTIVLLLALFVLVRSFGGLNLFSSFPQAEVGMEYGVLLMIGFLTSIHCVAMCGGINLTQCMNTIQNEEDGEQPRSALKPSLLYNAGRIVSYTVIGGIVGSLGSAIQFSGLAKGLVAILAGLFMVIMGLNMLNLFPGLRRFNPRMPKPIARLIYDKKAGASNRPFYIGLLNGLMPCGPLQAMQLYALSTGSPLKGAIAMFLFSLGTVPLMFGLGALSSLISRRFTRKMLKASAMLVVLLGVVMFQNGLGLSGLSWSPFAGENPSTTVAGSVDPTGSGSSGDVEKVQLITTQLSSNRYEAITVQVGVPVKWTIKAAPGTVNGCNNRLLIPAYKVEKSLVVGDNVIEFTPTRTGVIPYSCWMGMIRSKITVVDKK